MASQVRRSLVQAVKQIKCGCLVQRPPASLIRSYSTELQPQVSPKMVKIMEQRLSLIEQRNACLHSIINQIGSGDRSERIRTYNFPQGRVTDHRVGITHHAISEVIQGENLDVFIDALLL